MRNTRSSITLITPLFHILITEVFTSDIHQSLSLLIWRRWQHPVVRLRVAKKGSSTKMKKAAPFLAATKT